MSAVDVDPTEPALIRQCPQCGRNARPDYMRRVSPWLRRLAPVCGWARGVCAYCWEKAYRAGTHIDLRRSTLSRDDLLDDYLMLREQGYPCREIADRLGIHVDSMKRALKRARAAGDPRATHRPGGGW